MRGVAWIGVLLLGLCTAGCSRPVQQADGDEMDHPMMIKARDLEQQGDIEGARRIYTVMLEKHADMGRAHLGLALLLDRPGGDPVRAVYHYQRYLELRPDTEKRKMIEGRIRGATAAMVRAVYTNEASVASRLAELEREHQDLKVQKANLETRLAHAQLSLRNYQNRQARLAAQAERSLEAGGMAATDIRPAIRTVRVQKNDTLRRIAMRVYGSQDRWRDIYEANRNLLQKPEDVRTGQMLVVPE